MSLLNGSFRKGGGDLVGKFFALGLESDHFAEELTLTLIQLAHRSIRVSVFCAASITAVGVFVEKTGSSVAINGV